MADIFISYSRQDRALAEALARDLTSRGFSVWWDAELVGADDFYEVILEALQRAKAAIVIWSKASAKSRFVRDEARFAMHLQKLIAVKTPGLDVFEIPFGFQSQHTDDVSNRDQIFRAVNKLGIRPGQSGYTAGLDRINTGSIGDLTRFIASAPSNAQSHEALTRLRGLRSASKETSGSGDSAIGSLTRSNWQAFFDGFTLRIPKFQLSEQGTWTSVGAAVTYGVIAIGAAVAASVLTESFGDVHGDVPTSLAYLNALVFWVMAVFLWTRATQFLEQRNLIAAIILSLTFALQATLGSEILVRNAIWWTPTDEDKILYFAGLLIVFLNVAVWRIRAYR